MHAIFGGGVFASASITSRRMWNSSDIDKMGRVGIVCTQAADLEVEFEVRPKRHLEAVQYDKMFSHSMTIGRPPVRWGSNKWHVENIKFIHENVMSSYKNNERE